MNGSFFIALLFLTATNPLYASVLVRALPYSPPAVSTVIPAPTHDTYISQGRAVYYRRGLMESVYQTRIRQGLVEAGWQGDGYAATPPCSNIGKVVVARFLNPHTQTWSRDYRLLVVDCAQPSDYERQIASGLAMEVDYQTALAEGWVSEGKTQARIVRYEP